MREFPIGSLWIMITFNPEVLPTQKHDFFQNDFIGSELYNWHLHMELYKMQVWNLFFSLCRFSIETVCPDPGRDAGRENKKKLIRPLHHKTMATYRPSSSKKTESYSSSGRGGVNSRSGYNNNKRKIVEDSTLHHKQPRYDARPVSSAPSTSTRTLAPSERYNFYRFYGTSVSPLLHNTHFLLDLYSFKDHSEPYSNGSEAPCEKHGSETPCYHSSPPTNQKTCSLMWRLCWPRCQDQ